MQSRKIFIFVYKIMNEQLEKIFGPNFKLKESENTNITNNLGLLSLNLLESSPLFKFLRSELELYYKERKKPANRQSLFPYTSNSWKEHFYYSLQKLLNEVTYTVNTQLQSIMLGKVYKWYVEKSKRAMEKPKPKEKIEKVMNATVLQNIESTVPQSKKNKPDDKKLIKFEKYYNTPAIFSQNPIKNKKISPLTQNNTFFKSTNFTDQDSLNTSNEFNDTKVPLIRREQMKEVNFIKQRFACKNLSVSIKALEDGLVFSDFKQEILPPHKLPKGGEMLLSDNSMED